MKEPKRAACWVGATLALLFGLIMALSGCIREEYDFSSTVIHTDPLTTRASTDYAALAGVYKAEFTPAALALDGTVETDPRMQMYLMITEDGSFAFSNKLEFDSAAYGAGSLGLYLDRDPVFIYFAINNTSVTTGSRVARYEVGSSGEIRFLSPMWFGTRSPKAESEDGTEYPTFVPYHESDAEELTMGQEASEVIASVRAETTTAARTAADTQTDAVTEAATTAGRTTRAAAPTQKPAATRSGSDYTYRYNTRASTRYSYVYTTRSGDKPATRRPETTTAASRTTTFPGPIIIEDDETTEPLTQAEETTTTEG